MLNAFLEKINNKYTPRWIVLVIDIYLTVVCFIFAYFIIHDLNANSRFVYVLSIVLMVSLFCFLLTGSYKGVIRHTGLKDAINVFLALSLASVVLGVLNFIDLNTLPKPYFEISFSIITVSYTHLINCNYFNIQSVFL